MSRESIFLGLLTIAAIAATCMLFAPYLGTILVAIVFAMAGFGAYESLKKRLRSSWLAAILMAIFAIGFIFIPLGYLLFKTIGFFSHVDIGLVQAKLKELMDFGEAILVKIPGIKEQAASWINSVDIPKLSSIIFNFIRMVTAASAEFVVDAFFILLFYISFLVYGTKISDFIFATLPLYKEHKMELIKEALMSIRSLFYALFITAFLQGFIFAILIFFYKMDGIFWGLLYGIASMVPVVGGALVWIPLSIYVWINFSLPSALVMVLYSIVILGIIVDNFARPFVVGWVNKHLLQNHKGMHEVLVFFAMIAGIGSMGFFGIILGPTIVALTIVLMKLVQQKLYM